jgi:hypothetical protein
LHIATAPHRSGAVEDGAGGAAAVGLSGCGAGDLPEDCQGGVARGGFGEFQGVEGGGAERGQVGLEGGGVQLVEDGADVKAGVVRDADGAAVGVGREDAGLDGGEDWEWWSHGMVLYLSLKVTRARAQT